MEKRVFFFISSLLIACLAVIALFFYESALGPDSGSQDGNVNLVSANDASGFVYGTAQAPGSARVIIAAGPDATATPTPFQPVPPTSTAIRPVFATLTPFPATLPETPTVTAVSVNTVGIVNTLGANTTTDRVNILLLGTDQRSDPGFRTDVIMLVSINPATNTVSVISFPRDLYVTIPGWMDQRINTAFSAGGFNSIAATFQYNFNIRPQYYFLTNFQGFSQTIDDLDGIAVNAGAPLRDKCDLKENEQGYCTVEPGKVVMDGKMALWYVRSRHTSSDFDRTRRAQEVLQAIFNRMMKFDAITRLPVLYAKYRNSVETNMTAADMLPLLPVANAVRQDPTRIHRYTVGPGMVQDMVTPDGAMVLQPNLWAIQGVINQILYGD